MLKYPMQLKKIFSKKLVFIVTFTILALSIKINVAHAAFIDFIVTDHPAGFGLHFATSFGPTPESREFSFIKATQRVNTSPSGTGFTEMGGTMMHKSSGEIWNFTSTWNLMSHTPGGSFTPPTVPFNDMFTELASAGAGSGAAIHYDSIDWVMTPTVANPAWTHATHFIQKFNPNINLASVTQYWKDSPEGHPQFITGAWLADPNVPGSWVGDAAFVTSAVPEPTTMSLMGLGMSMLGFFRRRKLA